MKDTAPDPPPDSLSVDGIFDALADPRRRRLLAHLRTRGGSSTVTEAAEALAGDCDDATAGYPAEEVERVRTALYHVHVPKLEDQRLVAYDHERERIELTEYECYLTPYLRQAAKDERLLP